MALKKVKMPKQRIVCACFPYFDGGVMVIPIDALPMDYYNQESKYNPRFGEQVSPVTKFVTNHGTIANNREAFFIAVEAGQVEETRIKGLLCTTDLWPIG
jgi:hypothetical protein